MLEWSDYEVILAIYRAKTLSGAARSIGINQSTVSRILQRIESQIGAKIFLPSMGIYETSLIAQPYIEAATQIEKTLQILEKKTTTREPSKMTLGVKGCVRLSSVETLISRYLLPRLSEFTQKFPNIQLELCSSDVTAHLGRRQYDIALRLDREKKSSSLRLKKVGEMGIAGYSLKEKSNKNGWIGYETSLSFIPEERWLRKQNSTYCAELRVGGYFGIEQAVLQGFGIGLIPCFVGDVNPKLTRVTGRQPVVSRPLWLVTHPESRNQRHVQVFIDWLFKCFELDQDLLHG